MSDVISSIDGSLKERSLVCAQAVVEQLHLAQLIVRQENLTSEMLGPVLTAIATNFLALAPSSTKPREG
jgi:hypothetical protein